MIGDGEIIAGADVVYSILWQPVEGVDAAPAAPVTIVSFQHSFAGLAGPGQYSNAESAPPIPANPGDRLVLHVELASDSAAGAEYIPFGESPDQPSARWLRLEIP